jgi:hypothetical protein
MGFLGFGKLETAIEPLYRCYKCHRISLQLQDKGNYKLYKCTRKSCKKAYTEQEYDARTLDVVDFLGKWKVPKPLSPLEP